MEKSYLSLLQLGNQSWAGKNTQLTPAYTWKRN